MKVAVSDCFATAMSGPRSEAVLLMNAHFYPYSFGLRYLYCGRLEQGRRYGQRVVLSH
jgi:hypothetical protein